MSDRFAYQPHGESVSFLGFERATLGQPIEIALPVFFQQGDSAQYGVKPLNGIVIANIVGGEITLDICPDRFCQSE